MQQRNEARTMMAAAMLNSGVAADRNRPREKKNFTENAVKVLDRRYLIKDPDKNPLEDPDGMFRRVSGNLAQADRNYLDETDPEAVQQVIDRTQQEFQDTMAALLFLPNSPTLMNAGATLQQLSACFVLPVEDSLDHIFSQVKQTALIHKSGGGTGFSFGRLRPKGDLVGSTGGVASGPVGFIRAFDTATDVVKQGGTRRGANMAILRVDHPDILEFIHSKDNMDMLENFNISVAVTDKFMQSVKDAGAFHTVNPRNNQNVGLLNAREVWEQIVSSAHKTGDPGLMFIDAVNRDNPNPHLGEIESTNPCITGDTWVATASGPRQVRDLLGSPQTLLVNGAPMPSGPQGFFSKGVRKVLRISTQDGRSLRLTPDHLVAQVIQEPVGTRTQRQWTPAGELMPGDLIYLHDHHSAHQQGKSQLPMSQLARQTLQQVQDVITPEHVVIQPKDNEPTLCITNLPAERLELLQQQLAYLGIRSRVAVTAGPQDHELTITTTDIQALTSRVHPENPKERHCLEELADMATEQRAQRQPATAQVVSVEPKGEEEVFDVQVPGANAFDANGFYIHNCGEQPLLPNESCNLGSINLARMVRYDPDGGAQVDTQLLREVCTTAVHMMDNVIDVNRYPADIIGEVTRSTRRIGIGVMGWADLLVQLAIPYDSQEARDLAETIMHTIQENVRQASADLAYDRGPYPEWTADEHGGPLAVPMRNTAPTTIAPTGTISIIAGVSSGIEPLFGISYVRTVMDGTRMVEVNPYFQAAAISGGFHSQDLMERIAQTGSVQDNPDVPQWAKDIFKTASDISPEEHVLMQAAWQKYTDNAVSKTINFPNSATIEDIETAYRTAYETNCKGITVYRDGSHEDQVLSTGQTGHHGQQLPLIAPRARARPRVIKGQTERVRSGHGNVYITVNFHDGKDPFEVFCAVGKAGGCDSAQLEAVSRLASMALRSGIDPQEIIDNLKGITCCPSWDEGVLVRSVPDALAWGLSRATALDGVNNGVQQSLDPRDSTNTITIENRQQERLERHGPTICPDCSSDIVYQEGCRRCVNAGCGWSECE